MVIRDNFKVVKKFYNFIVLTSVLINDFATLILENLINKPKIDQN